MPFKYNLQRYIEGLRRCLQSMPGAAVGMYKSNPALTHSLKGAR